MASLLACSTSAEMVTSGAGVGIATGRMTGAMTALRVFLIFAMAVLARALGLERKVLFAFSTLDLVARTRALFFGFRLNGLTLRLVDTCRSYANRGCLSKADISARLYDA